MQTGNVMILFDEQLKSQGEAKQDKIFDFKVSLLSSKTFRQELNEWEDVHDEYLNTVASNPSQNCVLINKGKDPKEVVTDVTHGKEGPVVAEYLGVSPRLVVHRPGIDLTLNAIDPPPPPAGLGADLDNDLNDAVVVMQSLFEPDPSRLVTIPTNDWVSRDRPPIEIVPAEEEEESEEEDEGNYSLTDEVPTQILE